MAYPPPQGEHPAAGGWVYSDTDRHAVTEPITSHRLRLTGKPDYVYRTDAVAVQVEVKRRAAGRGPRDRDVAQLMAYCVPRNRQEAWKCRRCGFTARCGQAP